MRRRSLSSQPLVPHTLRVAMVAACPFPSPRGSQVLIRELARALAERGHIVHLVTYPNGESLAPLRGVYVHRVRPLRWIRGTTKLGWHKVLLDLRLVKTLYQLVRRERIQVIHAHNYEGPMIGYVVRRLTGVPVVYHSHNALGDELAQYFGAGPRRSLAQWVGRVLDHHVPRRADFSIALTPQLQDYLESNGVAPREILMIPPGVTRLLPTESALNDCAEFADRFVVMYAGNLDAYQDLDVLYRGFAAFSGANKRALLVLITHDDDWTRHASANLMNLVQQGHARVIVAPAFSVVRRFLMRADVVVCPRSSWSGFPMKLLNYMMLGRAIVAARGSAKGLVDGETGLLFENGDALGLSRMLQRVIEDPQLRERLGRNARTAVSMWHTWADAAARVEYVYSQVCPPNIAREQKVSNLRARPPRGLIGGSRDRISRTLRSRPRID